MSGKPPNLSAKDAFLILLPTGVVVLVLLIFVVFGDHPVIGYIFGGLKLFIIIPVAFWLAYLVVKKVDKNRAGEE